MSLLSSVSHGFIDGFWRRLRILVAKTKDFWQRLRIFGEDYEFFGEDYGFFGEDYGFLYLCQCLLCILMSEACALACTEHVQTY